MSALERFCSKNFLRIRPAARFLSVLEVSALEDVCFREVPAYNQAICSCGNDSKLQSL